MRLNHIFFIVFVLLPWQLYALGVDLSFKELYQKHNDAIDKVFLCGSWKDDSKEGVYRITHAFLYAQSYLYIQQMHFDQALGSYQSVHTISIKEFNHDHAEVSLEGLHCSKYKKGIVLNAEAYYGHENKSRQLNIKITGTNYSLK